MPDLPVTRISVRPAKRQFEKLPQSTAIEDRREGYGVVPEGDHVDQAFEALALRLLQATVRPRLAVDSIKPIDPKDRAALNDMMRFGSLAPEVE